MTTINADLSILKLQQDSMQLNASTPSQVRTLAEMVIGEQWLVSKVISPNGAPEWAMQLEDIGFIVGEPVTLMARGAFGGDPLVVRIGVSTFALRLAEAACVHVLPIPTLAAA